MALEHQPNLGPENAMAVPPPDIRVEDTNPPLLPRAGPFETEIIPKLPAMTSDQLSQLEEAVSSEFAALSKKLLSARQVRLDNMIAVIDRQIRLCQASDELWSQKYNSEVKLIEHLANRTENHVLTQEKGYGSEQLESLKKFDAEVDDLVSNLVLPLMVDDIFGERGEELPFAPLFKKIIQQFRDQLDALQSHKHYQEKLVDANVEKNSAILWKQYKRDALEQRQQLIDQTYLELNELYKEYYGVSDNLLANLDAANYYRSVVSVEDIRNGQEGQTGRFDPGNIDSYYDVDARYYKNNRVQVTDAKEAVLSGIDRFSAEQSRYTISQLDDANVKLSGLQGLTQEETDSDLLLLRSRAPMEPTESPKDNKQQDIEDNAEFQAVLNSDRLPSQVEMEPLELEVEDHTPA